MGLRSGLAVAGVGLAVLVSACSTSGPGRPSDDTLVVMATAAKPVSTTTPVDDPFGFGTAGTDTVGGSIPDGQTLSPFDVTNPAIAWMDPALLEAV